MVKVTTEPFNLAKALLKMAEFAESICPLFEKGLKKAFNAMAPSCAAQPCIYEYILSKLQLKKTRYIYFTIYFFK